MKILKFISTVSLAVGFAGVASAAPLVINVTGSTAFRSATTLGEIATVGFASGGAAASPSGAYIGASFPKATFSIVHGFLSDGTTEVYFRNDWTGATAGVTDLSNGNVNLKWIPTSATLTTLNSDGTGGNSLATGSNSDTGAPQVSMDDEQSNDSAASIVTAPNPGPTYASNITNAALQAGGTASGANAGPVAGPTFVWTLGVQSDGNPAPFTNVTQMQGAALLTNGSLPLSVLTGNSSDSTNFVLYIGRNEDSGSRCAYEAESMSGGIAGPGSYGASINQYMLKQSGAAYPGDPNYASLSVGSNTIAGFQLWPRRTTDLSPNVNWFVNTIPGLSWGTTGHSGYNTGGDVATLLETPNPVATSGWVTSGAPSGFVAGTSKVYFISCLGASDSLAVKNLGGTQCTWNGITYSTNAVQQGQYSIWTTEFLYYLNSATGSQVAIGSAKAAADALADALFNTPTSGLGNAGIQYGTIVAKKSGIQAGTFPQ